MKLKSLTLAAALLMSSASAFAADLTVAQRSDPNNWDPIDTFLISWSSAGGSLFDGLLLRDEDLKLQPGLAESWDVQDGGLKIRFTLRKGVNFHNGEAFDANAVKYTFDRLLGEEGKGGPQRSNYTSIKSVEIIDDYTVDFHMNQPDPIMLTKLAGYGSMIVPPKYIEEHGEEYFDMNPVGTGPFKLVSYTQGTKLELTANEDYFRGAPKLDNLTYRFIREDATRLAELLSGNVDVVHDLSSSSFSTVEESDNARLISLPGPSIQSFQFNLIEGITKDVKVRQALNMAVDKQMIVDALLGGYGEPISTLQGKLSFGYDPELQDYPYDPEQARKLLKEAGVAEGAEISIDYRSSNQTVGEIAQALSGFFGEIGINASVNPVENAVFINERVPNGETNELFQFGWGGWTFDFDNTAYLVYHSGEKRNPYLKSEEMDALLETQRQSVDQESREKNLQAVARLAHEQAYHLPLYNAFTVYAVSNKVTDFMAAPDDRVRYLLTDKAE